MKAVEIKWDIDIDQAYEQLDQMPYVLAAEAINIPAERYANMTTEERHDYAYDLWHHSPSALEEFIGLPNEVELPEELTDRSSEYFEEDISDWLSDEYGFCHKGFGLQD